MAQQLGLFERLKRDAERFGLGLSREQLDPFERYLELLLEWNQKINLTAIRTREAIVSKHFVDSLAVVPFLHPHEPLIDVGSGAGLPGIPIAIALPGMAVTLVESTAKKAVFLRQVSGALGLDCNVVQSRIEELRISARFGNAISRATFPPEEWLKRAKPLVRPGGRVIVMTGSTAPPEQAGGLELEQVFAYRLEGSESRQLGIYVSRET